MYGAHRGFETPADPVNLWRYMDVARFISLLHYKALYFASVFELSKLDPREADMPLGFSRYLEDSLGEYGKQWYSEARAGAVVNCWHRNETESVAMWRLYTSGAEGVAIKTTIGRLKSALAKESCPVLIGKVKYINHVADDDLTDPNLLDPIFCKRRSFRHESEIRAVIEGWGNPQLPRRQGRHVPVDLSVLINMIVVSPAFPEWALNALNELIERSGLSINAKLSDLREPC